MNNLIKINIFLKAALLVLILNSHEINAQTNNKSILQKPIKTSEKINQTSIELNQGTNEMNSQVEQAAENVKSSINHIKNIIRVFEPILGLHSKSNNELAANKSQIQIDSSNYLTGQRITTNVEQKPQSLVSNNWIPENENYNADGSLNLGNQNNNKFGCFLDIMHGSVLDDADVISHTDDVDLIFAATDYFGSAPMYALLTPGYVKSDNFSHYYFRGSKYKDNNIPVREWEKVNESEIALTNLTPERFDKIKDNNQLLAVIKQTTGFKNRFESRTSIVGKVFAVKTHLRDRNANALLMVKEQYGTCGSNGLLTVKIKVTGFDSNNDGNPNPLFYKSN